MNTSNHSTGSNWIEQSALAFTLVFLFLAIPATAQVFEWSRMGGGPGWKHGNGIAVDGQGNSFVVGEYSLVLPATNPAITFGTDQLDAFGVAEGFIVMYDQAGNEKWALRLEAMNATSSVTARSIALFKDGTTTSLYVTGEIAGNVQFSDQMVTATFGSSFIAKYSVGANYEKPSLVDWVRVEGPYNTNNVGSGSVTSRSVAVDGVNQVYICGSISGVAEFGGMSYGASGQIKLFVARYDNAGILNWIGINTGTGSADGIAVAANSGHVAVVGHFKNSVGFGDAQLTGPDPAGSLVVAKCDVANQTVPFMWAAMGVSDNTVSGRAVAVDEEGSAYIVGKFTGTLELHSQSSSPPPVPITAVGSDFFVAKYDIVCS